MSPGRWLPAAVQQEVATLRGGPQTSVGGSGQEHLLDIVVAANLAIATTADQGVAKDVHVQVAQLTTRSRQVAGRHLISNA